MSESAFTLLFTSAGRRVELMNCFRASMQARNISCRLLAAELNPEWSPACQLADAAFGVPAIGGGAYAEAVAEICGREGVSMVIPTLDPELEVLAAASERIRAAGAWMVVSPASVCRRFASKRQTAAFFESCSLLTPPVVSAPEEAEGPLFAKQERSSGSVGAGPVRSRDHVAVLKDSGEDWVFQPLITGTEFTIDLYLDARGQVHDWVARRRVEVRAGEVSKADTCRDADLRQAVEALAPHLADCRGPLTLQVIREADTGRIWYIEINPRFGGGYPLSFANGMDVPVYLEAEWRGDPLPRPPEHPAGQRMLRYDCSSIAPIENPEF